MNIIDKGKEVVKYIKLVVYLTNMEESKNTIPFNPKRLITLRRKLIEEYKIILNQLRLENGEPDYISFVEHKIKGEERKISELIAKINRKKNLDI